ncbi:conserved hypothetical protein [Ricinus communis]|uniref:Uncharacterized protein n=1 Tax=Ricinus communis TaxID=3988 RepID=B9SW77_RICCO|nr:conserved hypothetical protein [Ricinus communis]
MANKLISEIGLPKSISNIFAARNIKTAKDALSLTEFELMELLDVELSQVKSAVAQISAIVSPPYQTQIKFLVLQQQVKLLIIDSMAAVVSGENDQGAPRQHSLGWHISFIKSLAEFSRIPVLVTNQVRSQSYNEVCQYSFQVQRNDETQEEPEKYDSHLIAALGIHWAHAVTVRLVLEAKLGQRYIKVAKSPISPPMSFPFNITASGIALLDDDGTELRGKEINSIQCQGLSQGLIHN